MVLASLDSAALGVLCISIGALLVLVGRVSTRARRAPAVASVSPPDVERVEGDITLPSFHAVSRQRTTFAIGIGLVSMVALLLMLVASIGIHREQRREACWAEMEATAEIRGVQLSASGEYDRAYLDEYYDSMSQLEEHARKTCNTGR